VSLKKLQVLKEILNPKVNRADISVLEESLPPKVEFVITVPLTNLQENAYNTYVIAKVFPACKTDQSVDSIWMTALFGLSVHMLDSYSTFIPSVTDCGICTRSGKPVDHDGHGAAGVASIGSELTTSIADL
jgi:hypothetical protein